jgi:hypothetical protein
MIDDYSMASGDESPKHSKSQNNSFLPTDSAIPTKLNSKEDD